MSGPNPILATGRIRLPYVTDEPLTHNFDVYVSLTGSGTPPDVVTADGGSASWHDAVDQVLNDIKSAFSTATTFSTALLQKYVTGSYVEIDTYASSIANGASSSPTIQAEQATLGFRDLEFREMKLVFLGTVIPAPKKSKAGSSGAIANGIFTAFSTITAGHSGFYVQSRSAILVTRGQNLVTSFNRRSRRRLGLL